MTYDRDLKRGRRILWILVVLNFGTAVLNAYQHNWLIALSSLIWTITVLIFISMTRDQQSTRDEARLMNSVIHGLREEMDDR